MTNPVACENTLTGNPASEWDVTGAGGADIQGFATDISVNRGQTVRFKVNTAASAYRLDIYRMGYYAGMGARKVTTVLPTATLPQAQPACTADNSTGLFDCGVWNESASWAVPGTAVSGIYFAKLVRTDGVTSSSHIVFVVRDDTGQSDLLFQTSDTTWQAYNQYGGNSLYVGAPAGRAYKVSYNRPFTTRGTSPEDWVFNAEYPMVRFLEANGYNVSYSTGVDTDRRGSELLEHKAFLSVGHDEYWSGAQRANVETARAAGIHLAFFSGNEVFWKTRYEPSIDGSATAYRTLVCYKETHANAKIDPLTNVWTGTWRDPRFSPPADGNRPENRLTGTIFTVNQPGSAADAIEVSEPFGKLRLWRNTSLATLAPGATAVLSAGTLGYEWDEALVNGSQPTGLMRLSSTTKSVAQKLQDYGTTYAAGTATHSVTLYRHSTGHGLVFGAGTVQWSWGLDGNHDRGASVPDVRLRQATVNLFADMGTQPGSLQAGLSIASASSDTTAPSAAITAPANGATVLLGAATTVTGTAADTGGVVATVEISADGGSTWAPATGTASWSYSWTPTTLGPATLTARAVDDSGNTGAGVSVSVTVANSLPSSCPCSLWPDTTVPAVVDAGADSSVELGVKFTADSDGFVTALRFYKSAANAGPHVGSLWRANGTLLGSVTFSSETASGWQTQALPTAIAVTANTTYVVSYHINGGHYSFAGNYFASSGRDAGPLHAPATTVTPNGVYVYGATSAFPGQTYNAGNYWVDVVFDNSATDTTAPTVISVVPALNATGVDINANVAATFSEAINASTIGSSTFELRDASNALVPAVVSYDAASRTATLDPTPALALGATYTALIRGGAGSPHVTDTAGNALAANFTWSFTIASDTTPPTVIAVQPANGATGIATTAVARATFSEAIDPATLTGTTFVLRNASNTVISGAVTYDAATKTATLTPTAALAALSTYTATVKGGGVDPRVKDTAGNALSADFTWSFTTAAAAPTGCPCTIWAASATPASVDANDASALELGVKFKSDADGYISALRFYKSAANTGTHVGNLWTSTGTLLGSVTFANETSSGWQQAAFTTPIAITANTTYVASYFTAVGHYSASGAYFGSATDNPPLHALANGTSANGVYRYGAASGFPSSSYNATNYWVDVVYAPTAGSGGTPPTVSSVSPANGASGLGVNTTMAATFSEALDPATINSSTFELRDAANALVTSTVTWNSATNTATMTPAAPLQNSTTYTAKVRGGLTDPRVKDLSGDALAADYVWSFSTGASGVVPPTQGPGGPILVVTDPSNPFGTYYAEILRAEGLNEFAVENITNVNAGLLANYDVVILAQLPLSAAQVTMFTTWVNGGGNLIAMRPDKQLAGLLGLTDAVTTLANKYLLVNTATSPGLGIVNQTIQFHGTADAYTLNGASTVATLYSSAIAATANPAVTMRNVGTGTAAAFTYDLARSIVYTRQGNPAWAGQERDGQDGIRSDDLFFGAAAADPQPDWVDFQKIAIPQADEQQRLLANLILQMNLRRKPMPRFWYLPRGYKAAVVMTGDDHNNGGTWGRFNAYKSASPAGCSVANWECIRSTSYVFTDPVYGPPTYSDALAAQYTADGFEVAAHINTSCQNYTAASLNTSFTQQLSGFNATLPSAGAPKTNRTHCVIWSDYDSQPLTAFAKGIRLDTTYYYWPAAWVADRPGLFTGSGLPMRFAKADGTLIDVYQAVTQMNDEATQSYPATADALLDKALGPEGYYGTFVANMHTDYAAHAGSSAIISSAQARGVPVISARQLLTWVDARNASSFGALTWTAVANAPQGGQTLSFTLTSAADSNGLQGMLPYRLVAGVGRLTSLLRDGGAVIFTVKTVKGIEYVVFDAAAGAYAAVYDTTAPNTSLTSAPASATNTNTATFQFSATEAGSTFACKLDAAAFASCTSPVVLNGLSEGSHTFQVRATDDAGNADATPASYTWTVDLTAPAISARTPAPGAVGVATGSAVTVQFSEAMTSATLNTTTVRIRRSGAGSDLPATLSISGNTATLQPSSALLLGATYQATVAGTVADIAGNTLGTDAVWTFTAQNALVDATSANFLGGAVDANGVVSETTDGEVMLAASLGSEFGGSALPAGWSPTAWGSGNSVVVSGGSVTVDASRINPSGTYGPGRALEFAGTFGAQDYQHVGFGVTFNETPWAIFSTYSGGGLYARTHDGTTAINTLIPGSWIGAAHRYRIVWNTSSVVFFIDGVQVASHATTITTPMRPIISDIIAGAPSVVVNWIRMTPYAASSVFTSRVFDALVPVNWTSASWNADLPAGTSLVVSVRRGTTPTPDGTWTSWSPVSSSGAAIGGTSRYIQYQVTLSTTDPAQSPALRDMTLSGSAQ